jgi:hypothetical protein
MCCSLAAVVTATAGCAITPTPPSPAHGLRSAKLVASSPVFEPRVLFADRSQHFDTVQAADLDRDGRADIVAASDLDGIVVLHNVGGGRFRTQRLRGRLVPHPVGRGVVEIRRSSGMPSEAIALADLDGDGRLDLIGAEVEGQDAAVAYGAGRGFSDVVRTRLRRVGCPIGSIAVADVDGRHDVVLALACPPGDRTPGGIAILRNRGGRRGLREPVFVTSVRAASTLLGGDVDGDGQADLVADNALLRGVGGGRFARPRRLLHGRPSRLALADVAGHGSDDLVAAVGGGDVGVPPPTLAVMRRLRGELAPALVTQPALAPDGRGLFAFAIGDLTGDAEADVAIMAENGIWLSQSLGGGRFSAAVAVRVDGADEYSVERAIAIDDLDGDGRADVVSADADGQIAWLRNTGVRPLARTRVDRRALVVADRSVRLRVACTTGAGRCAGALDLLDGSRARLGSSSFDVAASERADVRIAIGRARLPRRALVRVRAPTSVAQVVAIHPVATSPARRAAACMPIGARMLARSRQLILIAAPDGQIVACRIQTGGWTTLFSDGPWGVFAGHVASVTKTCEEAFGCDFSVQVQTIPGQRMVTDVHTDGVVADLAVGLHGASAWITCVNDETCARGRRHVWRVDGRGLRRVASATTIDSASLRGTPDGRSFTWRDGSGARTSRWNGTPPATG